MRATSRITYRIHSLRPIGFDADLLLEPYTVEPLAEALGLQVE